MDEATECGEKDSASRVVLQELEIGLSSVAGELGGKTEQPEPEAFGLGPTPGNGEGGGAEGMQEWVGQDTDRFSFMPPTLPASLNQRESVACGTPTFLDNPVAASPPGPLIRCTIFARNFLPYALLCSAISFSPLRPPSFSLSSTHSAVQERRQRS